MAGMYAVYHGPKGLRDIAGRIHTYAVLLAEKLEDLGYKQENKLFFDTLYISNISEVEREAIKSTALDCRVNLRYFKNGAIGISLTKQHRRLTWVHFSISLRKVRVLRLFLLWMCHLSGMVSKVA